MNKFFKLKNNKIVIDGMGNSKDNNSIFAVNYVEVNNYNSSVSFICTDELVKRLFYEQLLVEQLVFN